MSTQAGGVLVLYATWRMASLWACLSLVGEALTEGHLIATHYSMVTVYLLTSLQLTLLDAANDH